MQGIALAFLVCLLLLAFSKWRALPPIPLYILAGLVLGASGLNLIQPDETSAFLTRLGLLFLLFSLGLEIKPYEMQIRDTSFFLGGIIDLLINLFIGFGAAFMLGFSILDAFVIALAFYISSSAMAVASLIENRKLILSEAETILWIMVSEDVTFIAVILLLAAQGLSAIPLFIGIVFVVGITFSAVYAGRYHLTMLLKRDDELPLLFTFSLVIGSIFLSELLGIPETLFVIVLGSALSTTVPAHIERNARPFREVFLIIFFVFFGISIDFSSGIPLIPLLGLAFVAIGSKLLSGILIGKIVHNSLFSGIEIWASTTARGEFSIALALVYGSPIVASTIAALVVMTSIFGSFASKYSSTLQAYIREVLVKKHVL